MDDLETIAGSNGHSIVPVEFVWNDNHYNGNIGIFKQSEIPSDRLRIAIIGSAGDNGKGTELISKNKRLARKVAAELSDSVIITGACPGIPNEVVTQAHNADPEGFRMGFSPKHKPAFEKDVNHSAYNVIIYVGSESFEQRGHYSFIKRDPMGISIAHAVVAIGGSFGTMHELSIACEVGVPIFTYVESGGAAQYFADAAKQLPRKRDDQVIVKCRRKANLRTLLNELVLPRIGYQTAVEDTFFQETVAQIPYNGTK